MKKQTFFTLLSLPFLVFAGEKNSIWQEYSKKLEKRIPAYGRNPAKDVQSRFASAGETFQQKKIFLIPAAKKMPTALFITGRNYFRLLKGTGERAKMNFDIAPYHYFSDSGYPLLPHLQKNKKKAECNAEFIKLLNRKQYGLLVTGTTSYRNPLLIDGCMKELETKIRNGFCWLEIGDIRTSPILKLFPYSERKTPLYSAPDGTKLFLKKIGKGNVAVLILKNQHHEGDYFRIYEAMSAAAGINNGIFLTLHDNKFTAQGKKTTEIFHAELELFDPVTKKRYVSKENIRLTENIKITPPENAPFTDYIASLVLFKKDGTYAAGCAGKYSLSNNGAVLSADNIQADRKKGTFQISVALKKNHPSGTLKLRLTDGIKRHLPFEKIQKITSQTQKAEFSLNVDYSFLNSNIGYAEVAFIPDDGKNITVYRKLFTAPLSTVEQHSDYQQIMWMLPKDENDLDSFIENSRSLGFNALFSGYYFKDEHYRQTMEKLSRYGMPVHLEYMMADNSVFGNFGAHDKQNKHFVDLGNKNLRNRVRRTSLHRAKCLSEFGVAAYACSEEIGLGTDETCFHPAVQYLFGKWCQAKYGTLAKLNQTWGTKYTSFDNVRGVLIADVLKKSPDKAAQWLDFRMFMEEMYNSLMEKEFFGSFRKRIPDVAAGYNAGPYVDVPTQGLNAARLGKTITYACEYLPGFLGFNMTLSSFDMLSARKIPYLYSVVGYPNGYQKTDANYDFRIWYTLLHGGRGNAWFSTYDDDWYSKFTADGSPSGTLKMIVKNSEDARNGLGKFIMDAEKEARSGIYYSRRSRYLRYFLQQRLSKDPEAKRKAEAAMAEAARANPGIMESSMGDSIGFALTDRAVAYMKSLAEDAGERWELVFEDDLLSGKIEKNYKVLFLPAVIALSHEEINALEKFVKNGGVLVADTMTGCFDENGNPNPERGKLDTLFGIKRNSSELPLFPVQNIKLANGTVLIVYRGESISALPAAKDEGSGILISNTCGKGKTLYLNGYFSRTKLHRLPDIPEFVRAKVKNLFPAPHVKTFSESRETPGIAGVEISRMRNKNAVLYTFHRRFVKNDDNITELRFDKKYHLYDSRTGKYFGFTERIPFTIPEMGRLKTVAALTAKAQIPEISVVKSKNSPKVTLIPASDGKDGHIFSYRMFRPDGKEECRFKKNLPSEQKFEVPFLSVDPKGTWKCVVKDVLSGKIKEITVENN